jgi:diaminopimelate epimerase
MIFDFIKTSPAQNTTVLITSYCPQSYYSAVAEKAMNYDYLHAEQVGFIVPPSKEDSVIGLEMAGGEFCGNATLSAAAYVMYKKLIDKDNFHIDVSGADEPIRCRVEKVSTYRYNTSCIMPLAKRIDEMELELLAKTVKGYIVEFEGISHFVLETKEEFAEYSEVTQALKKVIDTNAIGVIPYKTLKDGSYKIKPFVHVKKINTNIFERGCGSGSLALGIYLKKVGGVSKEIEVVQPGGVIRVGIGNEFSISTDVVFTCEGRMLI